MVFSRPTRQWVTALVAGSVVLASIGGLFVHTERAFLLAWPLAGLGILIGPWMMRRAMRVSRSPHREFWRWWATGTAFCCIVGFSLIVDAVVPSVRQTYRMVIGVGYLSATLATVFWALAVVSALRARSGQRTVGVDLVDWLIVLVVVSAPGLVVVVQRVLISEAAWFALPVTVAACLLTASVLPTIAIFARLPKGERALEALFVTLACMSTVNAWLLVVNAASGFSLPASPLLAVQAADMGLMVLLPLYSRRNAAVGLERLAAPLQIRHHGAELILMLVVAGVPVVLLYAWAFAGSRTAMMPLATGGLGALLGLVAVRYLLVLRETRRLYVELERLADERHRLLSAMLRASEGDSQRVVAQLHEEAASALVVLGAVVEVSSCTLDPGAAAAVDGALSQVRSDLSDRVDLLRELMVAVPIPDLDEQTLATAIRVHCHEVFGGRGPSIRIAVDPDLVLDWTTRTVLSRIAQEAITDVWRRGNATTLDIAVGWRADAVVLEVADEMTRCDTAVAGHDPAITAMRLLARLGGGTLEVETTGETTTCVRARLGGAAGSDREPVSVGPILRLVTGDR